MRRGFILKVWNYIPCSYFYPILVPIAERNFPKIEWSSHLQERVHKHFQQVEAAGKRNNIYLFPVGMTRNTSESWNVQILADLQGLIFDSRTKLTRTCFVVWRRVTWPNEEGGGGGGLALEAAAAQQEVLKQWGCQAGREGGDHPANISKSKDKTLAPLSSNRIIWLNKV